MSYLRPLHDLPKVIGRIGVVPGVWLVGGAAAHVLGNELPPRDWDFIVEAEHFQQALMHLQTAEVIINRCGGVKAKVDGLVIDIWPQTLAHFISYGTSNLAVSLLFNKIVRW